MQQQPGGDSRRYNNYGYTNFGAHASKGGNINNYYQGMPAPTVLEFLAPHVVHDALYNSGKRRDEHAVTCQIETRDKILNAIRSWANNPTPPICWLSGPAGTGKTTVAHTIAEEYERCGRLSATFFFWRRTGDRDDINKLVPTLAYQIAKKIPSAREQMERSLELKELAPLPITTLSLEDQLSKLLAIRVHPADRGLVVIDGLDECTSQHGIYRLIEWIRKNKPPFRFLFTSRPEPEIKAHFTLGPDVCILSLTESEDDIRKYFVEQLERVWSTQQRITVGGPRQWPSESDLISLVRKSEGLFEYAAMSVRYISGKGSPENRLKDLLTLRNGLDDLYAQVIEEAKEWEYFDIVIGSLMYLRRPLSINDLSSILFALDERLTSHGVHYALHGCHSILLIEDDTPIRSYHASLRDFLTDQSRSGTLIPAPETCHGRLMVGCLAAVTRAFNNGTDAPEYAIVSWRFHALFLLTGGEGLEELAAKTQDLVKRIDLNWVKSWMIAAISSLRTWNLPLNEFRHIKVRK